MQHSSDRPAKILSGAGILSCFVFLVLHFVTVLPSAAAAQTVMSRNLIQIPPVFPEFRAKSAKISADADSTKNFATDPFQSILSSAQDTAAQPMTLEELRSIAKQKPTAGEETNLPFDIRRDALREAAISYGARGGLAWRSYHVRQELEKRARFLDKVFDFNHLLIPAPSGFLIEPPIVSESVNSMIIEGDGTQAAVSDRIYNIMMNARIVSAPRLWRNYLERTWPDVEPPPDILRPEDDEERTLWRELVLQGWEQGVLQADEIFQDDLNSLLSDFRGMVRYRVLLAQGMISPPYALQVDRGITGDGEEMRIGDRTVEITGMPELVTGYDQWQPASR